MVKHAFEKAIKVYVLEDTWEPTGPEEDPTARLLSALVINGQYCHLEAYAVEYDQNNDAQVIAHPSFESNFRGIYAVGEPDKPYDTTVINNREYILTMTPYC